MIDQTHSKIRIRHDECCPLSSDMSVTVKVRTQDIISQDGEEARRAGKTNIMVGIHSKKM